MAINSIYTEMAAGLRAGGHFHTEKQGLKA